MDETNGEITDARARAYTLVESARERKVIDVCFKKRREIERKKKKAYWQRNYVYLSIEFLMCKLRAP